MGMKLDWLLFFFWVSEEAILIYLCNLISNREQLSERQRATIQADDELSECGKRGIAGAPLLMTARDWFVFLRIMNLFF